MRTRFLLFALALFLGFSSILLRCWQLQIQSEGLFEDKALKNQLRSFPIPAKRGEIRDTRGRVLAGNRSAYRIKLLDPGLPVTHSQLELLGMILGYTVDELKRKILGHRGEYFYPVLLREDIGRRSSTILLENKVYLPNIVIEQAPVRYYPNESCACHVLGYMGRIARKELERFEKMGYPRDALIGKAGLEKVFEKQLRGRDGIKVVQVDALGWPHDERVSCPPRPGKSIELTIDLDFQFAVERALEGRKGAVVLLDAGNGDILAMASYPNFDPNFFIRFMPGSEWKRLRDKRKTPLVDRAIEGEYQPGSTFKLITGYAALEAGIVEPDTAIVCNGKFSLGRRTAYCWKPGGHGRVSFERAIGQSCNVYFYNIGARIDVRDLASAALAFGLGRKTGIILPNERPGIVPDDRWRSYRRKVKGQPWTRGDTVNSAIGQGDVLVTPLQMARAVAAVSNGGKVFRPRLVKAIRDCHGRLIEEFPPRLQNDMRIEPGILEPLRNGLKSAVRAGTAWRVNIKGVTVFGKTGSAQNPGRKTHAWFVGVMESRRPSVAIAVLLEGAGAGGTQAVPVARKTFDAILEIIARRRLEACGDRADRSSDGGPAGSTASGRGSAIGTVAGGGACARSSNRRNAGSCGASAPVSTVSPPSVSGRASRQGQGAGSQIAGSSAVGPAAAGSRGPVPLVTDVSLSEGEDPTAAYLIGIDPDEAMEYSSDDGLDQALYGDR